jgi:hypothetical protein
MIHQESNTSAQDPSSPNHSFNSEGPFIQRAPHGRGNNFTMLSNKLLRDANLTFECRAFIAYLLSFDEEWKISVPWIMKTQGVGDTKMYRMIDEARKSGYLYREKSRNEKGHIIYNYFVSETPIYEGKFTKNPYGRNPCTENRHAIKKNKKEKNNNPPLGSVKSKPRLLKASKAAKAAEEEFSLDEKKEIERCEKQRQSKEPFIDKHKWDLEVVDRYRKRKASQDQKIDPERNAGINRLKALAAYEEWTTRPAAFKCPLNKPDDIGLMTIKTPKGVARLDSTLDPDEWDKQLKSWRTE